MVRIRARVQALAGDQPQTVGSRLRRSDLAAYSPDSVCGDDSADGAGCGAAGKTEARVAGHSALGGGGLQALAGGGSGRAGGCNGSNRCVSERNGYHRRIHPATLRA